MHKYLLLLAAAALALPARAQTERGSKLLGVSVGELTYRSYPGKDYSLSAAVLPSVGWFVADRLAVGAGLPISYDRNRTTFTSIDGTVSHTDRTWGYGLAPFARYYFVDAPKHKLFGQLDGALIRYSGRNTTKEDGQTTRTGHPHSTSKGWFAGVGYDYFVTPNVALEALAGYRRGNSGTNLQSVTRGSLDVRVGFSVFLLSGQGAKGN